MAAEGCKTPSLHVLAEHKPNSSVTVNMGFTQLRKKKGKKKTLHPACYTLLALYHSLLQFANED